MVLADRSRSSRPVSLTVASIGCAVGGGSTALARPLSADHGGCMRAAPANPLLEAALSLALFHRQHERFDAASPGVCALRLQRQARAMLARAGRWSAVEP